MTGALAAEGAVLRLLQPLGHRALVARRRVVPALAFRASKNRQIAGHFSVLPSRGANPVPQRGPLGDPRRGAGAHRKTDVT